MWNPCVKKKKKKRPCWEIVTLRGFSSHTSEELATHGAIGLMLGGFFFFPPELWLHQSLSHEHRRGMRGTRQQSHQLWQIPIYEQMLTQRWIEGGKNEGKQAQRHFVFRPAVVIWPGPGGAGIFAALPNWHHWDYPTLQGSTWFGKGCINNRKFGAKSKHAYHFPTKRD